MKDIHENEYNLEDVYEHNLKSVNYLEDEEDLDIKDNLKNRVDLKKLDGNSF